jgi:hypothetical protein
LDRSDKGCSNHSLQQTKTTFAIDVNKRKESFFLGIGGGPPHIIFIQRLSRYSVHQDIPKFKVSKKLGVVTMQDGRAFLAMKKID